MIDQILKFKRKEKPKEHYFREARYGEATYDVLCDLLFRAKEVLILNRIVRRNEKIEKLQKEVFSNLNEAIKQQRIQISLLTRMCNM